MANIARIRLPGFWIQNSVVDPDEFEALDEVRPWLANFATGSSHTPSGFVTVGGSGFQLTGTGHEVAASAVLNVQSSGSITVADGGQIKLNGTGTADIDLKVTSGAAVIDAENGSAIRIKSGASLDVFGALAAKSGSTSTWESGSTCTFNSGSTLVIGSGTTATLGATMSVPGQISFASGGTLTALSGANVNFNSGSTFNAQGTNNFYSLTLVGASVWPVLNTARTVTRIAVRPIPLTFNDGASTVGPGDPDMWECLSNLTVCPAFRTRDATASGRRSILEVVDLPIGAVITGAEVTTQGTQSGSISSVLPTYQIVSWASGSAGLVTHSSAETDAGTAASFGLTTTTTSISATGAAGTRTVTAGRRYGILITHPYEGVNTQGVWVYNATIEAEASSIQV